ncbi:hypothetical protein LFM09_44570 [Lentzea alba]|uniref:hypothetical protein n=1 Tax=Lentzea alba TaxID=2714351 RepID=UPI0039BEEBEB
MWITDAALLDNNHHLLCDGQILLADKGFAGMDFEQLTRDKGLRLLRPDRKDETFSTSNATAHEPARRVNRVAQRLLAMSAGIWHNSTTGVTSKRSPIAYDH